MAADRGGEKILLRSMGAVGITSELDNEDGIN
jgi:hypothetical protein